MNPRILIHLRSPLLRLPLVAAGRAAKAPLHPAVRTRRGSERT